MRSVVNALSGFRDEATAQTNPNSPFRLASVLSGPAAPSEIAPARGCSVFPLDLIDMWLGSAGDRP